MDDDSRVNLSGVNIVSLFGLLFVGLKLTGHIGWPWVWVLAPFWVPIAIICFLAFIAAIVYAFASSKSGK